MAGSCRQNPPGALDRLCLKICWHLRAQPLNSRPVDVQVDTLCTCLSHGHELVGAGAYKPLMASSSSLAIQAH